MRSVWMTGCALGLAWLLGGCASVFVTEPVGEKPVAIDPAQWQGTWVGSEFSMTTTVLDSQAGRLEVAWLERGDEGAKLEVYRGEVRQTGDWLFINMPHEATGEEATESATTGESVREYLWARLSNDGRRAVVWWPDPEAFRAAVRAGDLPGIVKDDDDVRLGPLQAEHLQRINHPASGLLNWEDPMVLIRIGD